MKRQIEWVARAGLCAWLLWIPLPFGSVPRWTLFPFVAGIAVVALLAILPRLRTIQDDDFHLRVTATGMVWGCSAFIFLAVVLVQLVPLPPSLVKLLAHGSFEVWEQARSVHDLLDPEGGRFRSWFPLTIDPPATRHHLARLIAYLLVFVSSALLIRQRSHRLLLTAVLGAAAGFQVLYGLEQWARGSREIWGWTNALIHNRVTGTFVNPNHFAHYLAIILPLAVYVGLAIWRRAQGTAWSFAGTVARLIERSFLPFGLAVAMGGLCLGGILVAQSRGALLALLAAVGGVLSVAYFRSIGPIPDQRMSRHRRRRLRLVRAGSVVFSVLGVLVLTMAFWIGTERTLSRFIPAEGDAVTVVGRVIGARAAVGVWSRFPLYGSGLGTFDRVVLMTQQKGFDKVFTHAHNDYLEILATTGLAGFIPAFAGLLLGFWLLARSTLNRRHGRRGADETGRLGSDDLLFFRVAAIASLATAMIHALIDFNFFIPANPATLAAILGAACAVPRRKAASPQGEQRDDLEPVLADETGNESLSR
ncbi:MAG TPA: O-antigen ligase family protein [Thermoanaerobaculia bacterium]|nr:O-antigen ligase family protein [Thermoanaerobaculia bacterium]